jgi:hypothetical protein
MAIINNLCAPALIYLFYSFSQIFIDLYKKMYNTAFLKFIIMIIFTFLLNMLCAQGLGIVSWIIVFIPFMLMSLITAILLYVFGLDPYSGKISSLRVKNPSATVTDSVSISQPHSTQPHSTQPHSTQPKNITIKASGTNSRPGTNDVIGNTFDSMNSKFDKIV